MKSICLAICLVVLAAPVSAAEDGGMRQWKAAIQRQMRQAVLRARGYPRSDRRIVAFTIDREGRLSNARIVGRRRADPRMDAFVLRLVTHAAPFPPMPASLSEDHFNFRQSITFR